MYCIYAGHMLIEEDIAGILSQALRVRLSASHVSSLANLVIVGCKKTWIGLCIVFFLLFSHRSLDSDGCMAEM